MNTFVAVAAFVAMAMFGAPIRANAEEVVAYMGSVSRPNMEQLEILERLDEEKELSRSDWFLRDHICHQDTFMFSTSKLEENPSEKCFADRPGFHTCFSKVQAASGRQIERKREYRCCTGYYLPRDEYECLRKKKRNSSGDNVRRKISKIRFVPRI